MCVVDVRIVQIGVCIIIKCMCVSCIIDRFVFFLVCIFLVGVCSV